MSDLVTFIHKTLNIPSKSTLIREIGNRKFETFTMITKNNVTKYSQKLEANALGQLDQKSNTTK